MEEDSGTHKHDVFEKLHNNVVMIKGNRPGLRAAGINHSRHDMLRGHGAFGKGRAGKSNRSELTM